jgi:hypothetical protein
MPDHDPEDKCEFHAALGRLLIEFDYVAPLMLVHALEAAANDLRFHNGLDEPEGVT